MAYLVWPFAITAGLVALIAVFPTASAAQTNPQKFAVAAPELTGGTWLNTAKGEPVTLASRKGKVTIVHFWTFG